MIEAPAYSTPLYGYAWWDTALPEPPEPPAQTVGVGITLTIGPERRVFDVRPELRTFQARTIR